MIRQYWGSDRAYHHTAPINLLYALHEALAAVAEEGLAARFARHRRVHEHLASRLGELGIGFVSQEGHRLPMLNAIEIPAGADDAGVRRALLERHGIEIGGGLGELKGRAWRVGLMGHGATVESVDALMTALHAELGR
jgi:alanine-glyoxylate transaminase/serine-glyoxylate transaminase/serine-pyruvate transaminase